MEQLSLSMEKAAEVLGVSYWTLQDWVALGRVPHLRVGRRIFFRPTSLQAWLAEQEIEAASRQRHRPLKVVKQPFSFLHKAQ